MDRVVLESHRIAPYKPIVQVDFDPMALGRFHPVTAPVLGQVGVTARDSSPTGFRRLPNGSISAPMSQSDG
jgi:thiamine pyrophosphate-dependent acetolactate synthase large subunit-like protein